MRHRSLSDRIRPALAWYVAFLMIVSVLPVFPFGGPAAAASSRATITEQEPNNNYAEAPLIASGDIVKGELDWDTDKNDVVKIHVTANQILNVSFVQTEYNPGNPNEYNIDLELLAPLPQHALIKREVKKLRVDTISAFCVEAGDYFIWLYIRSGSKSVNYTLNAEVTTLSPIGRGDYPGSLDATDTVAGTNPYRWFMLSIPTTMGIQVTLDMDPGCDFDLYSFIQWDNLPYYYPGHKNPPWLNASTENATGMWEFLKSEAWDGTYYLKIKAWPGSKGSYDLSIIDYDPIFSDGDNTRLKATLIEKKGTTFDHLHQSFDHFDWYKLSLDKDVTINITMSLLTNVGNVYNLSIYNQDHEYITGVFDTYSGNYYNSTNKVDSKCDIINFTAPSTGYYYIMVMPVRSPSWWGELQTDYSPIEADYKIEWDLPNLGPDNILDIPDIYFPEDTVHYGPELYVNFDDPEDDPLTFSVEADASVFANLTVDITQANGSVVLTPKADWNTGDTPLTLTFKAEDPGANTGKFFDIASVDVTVEPVNDLPYTVGELDDMVLDEEQTMEMATNLYDVFKDIDDDLLNFSVLDNGSMPVNIDDDTGLLTVGPASGWYGVKLINITGTDSGDASTYANFTVTVNHVNHPPEVVDGLDERTMTIEEDQVNVSVYVVPWFTDMDKDYTTDQISLSIGTPVPKNLLATVELGFLKIVPLSDWNGEDIIWVEATDNSGAKAKIRLLVTVTPVNDAPIIKATDPMGAEVSVNEGMDIELGVTVVEDIDTNESLLVYTWFLDDGPLGGTESAINMSTDFDPATSVLSAGEHVVKVVVNDTELMDSFEWNMTIYNVNQGPENIGILSPEAGYKFKFKEKIVLVADNATDMDGDTLTYTWKNNATGEVLGENQTLEIEKLKKGDYVVLLEVTDGKGGKATSTIEFKVKGKKETQPGFEAVVLIAAVVIASVVLGRRRRR